MSKSSIEQQIGLLFADAFTALDMDADLGRITKSQRPELGQFQCNGALPAAKRYRRNPLEIAKDIAEKVQSSELLKSVEVTPPGFINIKLADDFLASSVNQLTDDALVGIETTESPEHIALDFGGPNAAKPLHVGHLRSSIIGESLKRTLRTVGHKVTGDIHLGDWGTQMGMMIEAIKKTNPELPYFDENFKGDYPKESPLDVTDFMSMYPEASQLCKSDPEEMDKARQATLELQQGRAGYRALWQHIRNLSIEEMKPDFERLGVTFDLWYGEADADPYVPVVVQEAKEKKIAIESEGALVVPYTDDKGKEQAPMILLKSDGAAIYATTDLATIKERVENLKMDRCIYVVDNRQDLHFRQVFNAATQLNYLAKDKLTFAGFGTMNGPDNKPFKTRDGGVLRLTDLIKTATDLAYTRLKETGAQERFDAEEMADIAHKVAIATIKFADLHNDRKANYIFDLEKFSQFEGKTGPYLLYSAVRMKSILRKAEESGLMAGNIMAPTTEEERELMLAMMSINKAVETTIENLQPHHLCDFSYGLSQSFSRFYNASHIMAETDKNKQQSWLGLTKLALKQQERILDMLGIAIPERM